MNSDQKSHLPPSPSLSMLPRSACAMASSDMAEGLGLRRNRDRIPSGGGSSRRSTRGVGSAKHKSEFVVYTGPNHEPNRELTKEQAARKDREQVLGTRVSVSSARGREGAFVGHGKDLRTGFAIIQQEGLAFYLTKRPHIHVVAQAGKHVVKHVVFSIPGTFFCARFASSPVCLCSFSAVNRYFHPCTSHTTSVGADAK